MHDIINASIANQRVRELVESGETRRAVRDRKRRPESAKPTETVAPHAKRGAILAAVLRVRRSTM